MIVRGKTLLWGLFTLAYLLLAPFTATAALQDGQRFQDWTARCVTPENGGTARCTLAQIIFNDEQQPVVIMEVQYLPDAREQNKYKPVALIMVPHNVVLQQGLEVSIDQGEPVRLAYEYCNPAGCLAGLLLDDKVVGSMKRGLTSKIKFFMVTGHSVTVDISLRGFTAGFNNLTP